MANGALVLTQLLCFGPPDTHYAWKLRQGFALRYALTSLQREAGTNPNAFSISDLLLLLNPECCLECLLQRGMKWMFI